MTKVVGDAHKSNVDRVEQQGGPALEARDPQFLAGIIVAVAKLKAQCGDSEKHRSRGHRVPCSVSVACCVRVRFASGAGVCLGSVSCCCSCSCCSCAPVPLCVPNLSPCVFSCCILPRPCYIAFCLQCRTIFFAEKSVKEKTWRRSQRGRIGHSVRRIVHGSQSDRGPRCPNQYMSLYSPVWEPKLITIPSMLRSAQRCRTRVAMTDGPTPMEIDRVALGLVRNEVEYNQTDPEIDVVNML